MGFAVPTPVGGRVGQAEVGRQVDDALGELTHRVEALLRLAVGQGQEQDVGRFQDPRRRELEIGDTAQVGVDGVDRLAGVALGGHLVNSHVGVAEQQPQ